MPPFTATASSSTHFIENSPTLSFSNFQNEETAAVSNITMKRIKKLQAEVRKLKAIADFTKAEAEETISDEMDTINEKIDEKRMALTAAKIAKNRIHVKIGSQHDFNRLHEQCIMETEEKLKENIEDREQLEKEVQEQKGEREKLILHQKKLKELVRSATQAIEDLLKDQETIVASTHRLEQKTEEMADKNISMLSHLLERELEFKRQSEEIRYIGWNGDGNTNSKLIDVMKQQREQLKLTLRS